MVRVFLYSLVLGCLCYLIYYPLTEMSCLLLPPFSFLESLANSKLGPKPAEILWVSGLSIPLGMLISFVLNRHWLHLVAQRLKVSMKFPEADVWSLVMDKEGAEWVIVRDLEHDLMYRGWVLTFSDSTDDLDEVLLIRARVYRNSTGQKLYDVPGLYLSTRHGNKTVEFPKLHVE